MKTLQWNDSLSIGVDSIDSQHKELIRIVNELITCIDSGNIESNAIKIMHELKEYTVLHFVDEEKYMNSIKYNKINEHRAAHNQLKHSVSFFQSSLYHHECFDKEKSITFIKHWLLDHVLGEDMKIKEFILQNEKITIEVVVEKNTGTDKATESAKQEGTNTISS